MAKIVGAAKRVYMDVRTGDLSEAARAIPLAAQKERGITNVFLFKGEKDGLIFVEEVSDYLKHKDGGRYDTCRVLTLDQFRQEYDKLGYESMPFSVLVDEAAGKITSMKHKFSDHSNVVNAALASGHKSKPSLQSAIDGLKAAIDALLKIL